MREPYCNNCERVMSNVEQLKGERDELKRQVEWLAGALREQRRSHKMEYERAEKLKREVYRLEALRDGLCTKIGPDWKDELERILDERDKRERERLQKNQSKLVLGAIVAVLTFVLITVGTIIITLGEL